MSQRTECKPLRARFLREAKVRLDLERGRASITTLQALVLLFLHEGVSARDRIGRTYYLQAMDMWRRLGFHQYRERPYECEGSEIARDSWRATTVAVWGIFCAEKYIPHAAPPNDSRSLMYLCTSFMSFLTGFEPSLPPPLIEKYFEFIPTDDRTDLDSRDGDWSPYPMQRPPQRALLAKTLSALCALCQLYHEISVWNNASPDHAPLGSQQDVVFRIHMFKNLASWNAQLHLGLRPGVRSAAHKYYLM